VREITVEQRPRGPQTSRDLVLELALDPRAPLTAWQKQDGVVAQLIDDLRFNQIVFQVGVAIASPLTLSGQATAEADTTLAGALRGKDPVNR